MSAVIAQARSWSVVSFVGDKYKEGRMNVVRKTHHVATIYRFTSPAEKQNTDLTR